MSLTGIEKQVMVSATRLELQRCPLAVSAQFLTTLPSQATTLKVNEFTEKALHEAAQFESLGSYYPDELSLDEYLFVEHRVAITVMVHTSLRVYEDNVSCLQHLKGIAVKMIHSFVEIRKRAAEKCICFDEVQQYALGLTSLCSPFKDWEQGENLYQSTEWLSKLCVHVKLSRKWWKDRMIQSSSPHVKLFHRCCAFFEYGHGFLVAYLSIRRLIASNTDEVMRMVECVPGVLEACEVLGDGKHLAVPMAEWLRSIMARDAANSRQEAKERKKANRASAREAEKQLAESRRAEEAQRRAEAQAVRESEDAKARVCDAAMAKVIRANMDAAKARAAKAAAKAAANAPIGAALPAREKSKFNHFDRAPCPPRPAPPPTPCRPATPPPTPRSERRIGSKARREARKHASAALRITAVARGCLVRRTALVRPKDEMPPEGDDSARECAVCMEDLTVVYALTCGHCFCMTCSEEAVKRHACHKCRQPPTASPIRLFM